MVTCVSHDSGARTTATCTYASRGAASRAPAIALLLLLVALHKYAGTMLLLHNDAVGRAASLVNQSCKAKNKDIRKFLDGIYVSAKGPTNHMKFI